MTTVELARRLGISRGTVSRVLNNHPNVKEETRQRVLAALKEYDYTPNETARALVRGRPLRLAVIVFSEPQFFWQQVEQGVTSASGDLKTRGVEVDYFSTDILNPAEQLELLRTLPGQGYDGIAIAPNDTALLAEEVGRLCDEGYPVVVFNAEMPAVNHLCYIGSDYVQAGVLAAELLAKCMGGRGEVAILTLKEPVSAIEQRVTGFRKELSQYEGINIRHIRRFDRRAEGVYDDVKSLLEDDEQVNGIFVSIGALEQTAQACIDAGRGQVSVVGYDLNEDIYRYLKAGAISATIGHEAFGQGYYAVKILHRYLDQSILPASSIMYTKLEAIVSANAKYYLNERMLLEMYNG
ncbi:LacI family DNA-binding transcriptional regulator [Ruminococcaceae bacterium OttesenSCG-928-D13]|nr:LacI family DNA-binding transcriptional regulator [Ruminococcaceae bacterium OttesenSCG-928-D13]